MEKEITSLSIRKDIKKRSDEALERCLVPGGVGNFSGLVERALEEFLDRHSVPKIFIETQSQLN